ncbi:hypothetical protein [Actinoplanes regularis]|uniref:DUF1963 domain-containing protein n=1 Tax=Actinoplanes regularis TaxID=52697 RepID=A0A239DPY4_9ACTN|nr:hypothetical protein [Actinoplanes regularis]GIE89097.1 hypothetical protein Are01nite_55770 [Actinoplanes regularis]SNS33664.1 hypothetical protein SAMN06264365_1143 [Actinoplanes regularis]
MVRTTPPRPLDITELFPGLREHSTTATRLHPRPGTPTTADSSVGGPLLWPAGEAWPVCDDAGAHEPYNLTTPAALRRRREILATANARTPQRHGDFLTAEERAELDAADALELDDLIDDPIPLIPVAQLYRRDIPDYAGPDGTDVLQVLWCPVDHSDRHYSPRVFFYWRDSSSVGPVLEAPPEPPVISELYLPVPCVVHPEQVREYQYADLLPDDLREQLDEWGGDDEDDEGPGYQSDLSLAPGWKVGGYANWSLSDPHPVDCEVCGTAMTLTFTADSADWNGTHCSWRPLEEDPDTSPDTVGVQIGRGYSLYAFRCPESFDHPPATAMQ